MVLTSYNDWFHFFIEKSKTSDNNVEVESWNEIRTLDIPSSQMLYNDNNDLLII